MKIPLIVFCCLFHLFTAYGQNSPKVDSLLQRLNNTQEDSSIIKIYHSLFAEFKNYDLPKADSFARQALHLSLKKGYKKFIAASYLQIGRLFADQLKKDSAITYYEKSIAVSEEIKNYEGIASNYVNIGSIYFLEADWLNALENYNKALEIAEEHNFYERKLTILRNIAGVYYNQKDLIKAEEFTLRALALNQKENPKNISTNLLSSLASIYTMAKDTANALNYFNQALLSYTVQKDSIGIAETLSNIGTLQSNADSALQKLLLAKSIFDRINPNDFYAAINLANLGNKLYEKSLKVKAVAEKTKLLSTAKFHLENALQQTSQLGLLNYQLEVHDYLSKVEETRGDYKASLFHLQQNILLKDSLYSQDTKNEIAQKANVYDLSLRDKQIALNELALKNSRNQRIALIIGMLLLTVIGFLLYYQSMARKKANTTLLSLNNQLDEANKVKTKFFGILSHDLRGPIANLVSYLHLQRENKDLLTAEAAQQHEERITKSAEMLLENMESMLLWSKSQMERFKPQEKQIAVKDLFHFLQEAYQSEKEIQFTFSTPEQLTVVTDEDYLKAILMNLTNNAIKVLDKTKNSKIKWEAYQKNNQIILSITDNGPGVNKDQLKALHDEEAPITGKTGFGLHIIRDLAKAINCAIDVSKNPQETGTVFSLSI